VCHGAKITRTTTDHFFAVIRIGIAFNPCQLTQPEWPSTSFFL
jgi:hypothetical protein